MGTGSSQYTKRLKCAAARSWDISSNGTFPVETSLILGSGSSCLSFSKENKSSVSPPPPLPAFKSAPSSRLESGLGTAADASLGVRSSVGSRVGVGVGLGVGSVVGRGVGSSVRGVGSSVGLGVGEIVGASVGLGVGTGMEMALGPKVGLESKSGSWPRRELVWFELELSSGMELSFAPGVMTVTLIGVGVVSSVGLGEG
mmetsp:Transcript_24065/g.33707  ORF Transcript_24065/g.33707 Transcript_24065/m.33707 type:complete len:200 (+) Transcript_24065:653-1252(+)